ncbi:MAG: sodium-independent anion transporter [Chloroflexi bacterium]|nr:MAG: sodium-independent anion transporter [Chloroflexota bacterium]
MARLLRRLPILQGILPYERAWLPRDILAGVTLAALAIPEVMGYTKIAGMPVVTGLYTLLLPVVAFALLGSSRRLVVGADSATAAIMFAGFAGLGISGLQPQSPEWVGLASLSALLVAALLFLARLARLGFLADFLSRTVLIGFLTGVGIQVAMSQVGDMLGISSPAFSGGRFGDSLRAFWATLQDVDQTSGMTLLISLAVVLIVVGFERWVKHIPGGLVAVAGMILVSWAFDLSSHGVRTLGAGPGGLPAIAVPYGVTWQAAWNVLPIAASMAVVILAQSAATSRAYATRYGERFDENADLLGLGVANVGAGLTGTFVVNGSPTKTEMVDDAKGRTQVAHLTMAGVTALVLLVLTKPLEYMPHAVLAAVVFIIGLKLIDYHGMLDIYRLRRDEFVVATVTVVTVVVVGVEQGMILAIVLSVLVHVRRSYHPANTILIADDQGYLIGHSLEPGTFTKPGLVVYHFGTGIFFANANRLEADVHALMSVAAPPRWFILDASSIDDVDYTGGKVLLEVAEWLITQRVTFGISHVSEHVRRQLEHYGITATIGAGNVYVSSHAAIDAFDKAQPVV